MSEGNDKRTIIAVALCVVFYLAYTEYLRQKYPNSNELTPTRNIAEPNNQTNSPTDSTTSSNTSNQIPTQVTESSQNSSASIASTQNAVAPVKLLNNSEALIETDVSNYRFALDRSAIESAELKEFKADTKDKEKLLQLVEYPLQFQLKLGDKIIEHSNESHRNNRTILYSSQVDQWMVTQEFHIPEKGYEINYDVQISNLADSSRELKFSIEFNEDLRIPPPASMFDAAIGDRYSAIYYNDGSLNKQELSRDCTDGFSDIIPQSTANKLNYIGYDKHYFLTALLTAPELFQYQLKSRLSPSKNSLCNFGFSVSQDLGRIASKDVVKKSFKVYLGPKQVDTLSSVSPELKSAVDLGWFDFFGLPLLAALQWINRFVNNFGWTIIIVTALLKIAFYPLTRAATVSAKKMQKLNPQMNLIREKYKDDAATMQKELMKFMAENKINPAKGCLPILPQIPVFIAFYNVLSQSIELRHAPFLGWIQDLASKDPYYITPVLLGVGMFLQTKLTPNPGMDKTQEKVMLIMPIIFSVMMISLPSGMVIYMLTNTIISIAQQQWLNRSLK